MAASFDLTGIIIHSSTSPLFTGTNNTKIKRPSPNAISTVIAGDVAPPELAQVERSVVRLGLPSKGRMSDETLNLLKSCQLAVRKPNPRQCTADIPLLPNLDLEVWFQRPKDIVRKLQLCDLDLGMVGYDTVSEYGQVHP